MTPNCTRQALVASQDAAHVRALSLAGTRAHWRIIHANSFESVLATLGTRDGMLLDAVVIDLPERDALLAEMAARRPALPVLVEGESIGVVAAALRHGATDVLLKPISAEAVCAALDAVLATTTLQELRPLSVHHSAALSFAEIVGSDAAFRAALAMAAKGARSRAPILIEGPDGSGKGLIARAIHAASPRDKKPLIVVNCAEFAANQIDSELFGHDKGAFAGAFDRKIGKAVLADGGTLVISHVERMPAEAQIKLLRLIAHGEVQPVGSRTTLRPDVRLITTTPVALGTAAKAGRFREDIYSRLATVMITVPPLNARRGDVPILCKHLLARNSAYASPGVEGITDPAIQLLSGYHWPGNVRQLQNVLLRAALACSSETLTMADFPALSGQVQQGYPPRPNHDLTSGVSVFSADGQMRTLGEIEADVIRLAIGHYRGRMSEVARRLGIGRSTLYRKLDELGIAEVA